MTDRLLALNPTTEGTGTHDPSAAIFEDGELLFATEEERYNRRKHSVRSFPAQSIQACLDYCNLELSEIDKVVVGWDPKAKAKYDVRIDLAQPKIRRKIYRTIDNIREYMTSEKSLRTRLSELGTPVPQIVTYNHHLCHAASAFTPSGFEEAIIITLDGRGERDATVVWEGNNLGLERIRTYEYPNSLGAFYATITTFLGYRANNGEGKIMGLAPYGKYNQEIEDKLLSLMEPGVDYDVRSLNFHTGQGVSRLERLFDRKKKSVGGEFSDWEKDLAFTAQRLLEETVADMVETFCNKTGIGNVGLAGGVALNCKMNKRVMDLDVVDNIFIQPVANDAGCAIGAGLVETGVTKSNQMSTVYWGPRYSTSYIKDRAKQFKLNYVEPDNLEELVAESLAAGDLVGWFQGRMEMGPRALGNRSILADPRTEKSRDHVNNYVKHREEWRPFCPSLLEDAADDYLVNAEPSPYMIKTFDVKDDKNREIPAVLHKGDKTTRPQTVNEDQNPRFHRLLKEFQSITGVPVLLNTSFNDHGEPIVNTPTEAIKDFFGMGLDILVLEDIVIKKPDMDA